LKRTTGSPEKPISLESLMATTHKLGASMEALAALGAELRLRRENLFAAPRTRKLLQELVARIDPGMLDAVSAKEEQAALGVIEGLFRQAADLLQSPARAAGWSYTDPSVLQGQGLSSRRFIHAVAALASGRADLKAALEWPGVLLDVGTGAGWMAIEAARLWPQWRIVGIDRWEPALRLARENVVASGLERRIELRAQSVEQLEDEAAFTLAWLPGPFLPPDCVNAALERVRRALVPGGFVVFGVMTAPSVPWGEPLAALRVVRNGAHPWKAQDIVEKLAKLGFGEIVAHPTPGTTLVVAKVERRSAARDEIQELTN